jgi:RNA polymerase sigma factor (sigma-70 family)
VVRRHAGLVWSVCQRVLADVHDAEDAFQSTFLVLHRKAVSLGRPASVAGWLHTVACHVALRARAAAGRRRQCEKAAMRDKVHAAPDADTDWRDLQPVLDEELSRLPARFREPVVLCYLQGKTEQEAARLLGCPMGTVSWRLVRARELLRTRLTRRGLALSSAVLGTMLTQHASAAAPPALVETTLSITHVLTTTGRASCAGVASPQVTALTEGVLKAMWTTKLKTAAALVLAVGLAGSGLYQVLADKPAEILAQADEKTPSGRPSVKNELTPATLAQLHTLIRPHDDEWRHLRIHWITDVVAARKKAAREDKPIVILYTGGAGYNEPLGVC